MTTLIDDRAASLLTELDLDIDADEVEILERALPQNFQALLELAWGIARIAQNAQNVEAQEAADDNALWATAGAIC